MAVYGGPEITTRGLVLYLDAANNKSYPGSGTIWTDLSGNGNHGTLLNGPSFTSSNKGSIGIDGTNDYVRVNHSDSLNFTGNFTVEVFVKINTNVFTPTCCNAYNIVSKKATVNQSNKGWMCYYDFRTNGILQLRTNDGSGSPTTDSTPTSNIDNRSILSQTNNFVYSCWTSSFNIANFFVNGVFKRTSRAANAANYADLSNTTNLWIGMLNGSSDSTNFNIGMVKIYNRVLSDTEIFNNYNALKGRYGL